jgi:hypothetical protein
VGWASFSKVTPLFESRTVFLVRVASSEQVPEAIDRVNRPACTPGSICPEVILAFSLTFVVT